MTRSFNLLLQRFDPIIQKYVNKQSDGPSDVDELYQAGRIGLWKAVEKYEPGLSEFDWYAEWHVRVGIRDEARRMRKKRSEWPDSLDLMAEEGDIEL